MRSKNLALTIWQLCVYANVAIARSVICGGGISRRHGERACSATFGEMVTLLAEYFFMRYGQINILYLAFYTSVPRPYIYDITLLFFGHCSLVRHILD